MIQYAWHNGVLVITWKLQPSFYRLLYLYFTFPFWYRTRNSDLSCSLSDTRVPSAGGKLAQHFPRFTRLRHHHHIRLSWLNTSALFIRVDPSWYSSTDFSSYWYLLLSTNRKIEITNPFDSSTSTSLEGSLQIRLKTKIQLMDYQYQYQGENFWTITCIVLRIYAWSWEAASSMVVLVLPG